VTGAVHAWASDHVRGLRVLPLASLHVTLVFLGERPESEVSDIGEEVLAAARPVSGLLLDRPAALGRGRALAIDLRDGREECRALQASLSSRLSFAGARDHEHRTYRPHLTVARGERVTAKGLPALPATGVFDATAVTLFRSHLGRGGARYEALVSAPLHVLD